jgi:uncharacterized membrane protein
MQHVPEKRIHQLFEISVLLKGMHAILELIGGVFLIFISTNLITQWVAYLTQEELTQDPNDIFANYLLHSAQHLSIGGKTFAAWYLLSHGLIKLFLVAGLLRDKLWAYPASLVVLGLFIVYQLYRFTDTHSMGLIALTIFDLIVMALVWHEYRLIRKHLPRE